MTLSAIILMTLAISFLTCIAVTHFLPTADGDLYVGVITDTEGLLSDPTILTQCVWLRPSYVMSAGYRSVGATVTADKLSRRGVESLGSFGPISMMLDRPSVFLVTSTLATVADAAIISTLRLQSRTVAFGAGPSAQPIIHRSVDTRKNLLA